MRTRYTAIRRLGLAALDAGIVCVSYYAAFWLRFDAIDRAWGVYAEVFRHSLPWLLAVRLLCGLLVRQYTWSFAHASLPEAVGLIKGAVAGSLGFIALCHVVRFGPRVPPRSVYVLEFLMSLTAMGFLRFLPRYLVHEHHRRNTHAGGETELQRTLILGAGHLGELLLRDIVRRHTYPYEIVGFVDDAPEKRGMSIHGKRVLGTSAALPDLINKHRVDGLLIAVPAIKPGRLREIIDLCGDHQITFKIVPSYADVVTGEPAGPVSLKDIQLEDLLERSPVRFDSARMTECFIDRTILITGAAGSIGSELCRQIVRHSPKRIVALDLNENDLYMLRLELTAEGARDICLEIGSVQDARRMQAVFARHAPEVVFHAAAHKHVPLMEHCPGEALKNNAVGTRVMAACAHACGSERFVLISTDKAVNPANVMGASKWLAELVVREFRRRSSTRFMAVRFGNVLGSNGSLVPILRQQIAKGGPVTITHPKIMRYFMTIPEAVGLVLTAAMQDEGTVCVLDMDNALSVDRLARQMISLAGFIPDKDIPIVYTGLRPGEKMYEELFTATEELAASSHPKIRIARCTDDLALFETIIAALDEALRDGSDAAVRTFLREHVPGYGTPAEQRTDGNRITLEASA